MLQPHLTTNCSLKGGWCALSMMEPSWNIKADGQPGEPSIEGQGGGGTVEN